MFSNADVASRFFHAVTARPRLILLISVIMIAIGATGLTRLVKDTSVKAFIPPDHPVLQADEHAAEVFGLSDTVAVAIVTRDESSIFTPAAFELIADLSARIADLPNIRQDRVTSLATEVSISGSDGAVDVTREQPGLLHVVLQPLQAQPRPHVEHAAVPRPQRDGRVAGEGEAVLQGGGGPAHGEGVTDPTSGLAEEQGQVAPEGVEADLRVDLC